MRHKKKPRPRASAHQNDGTASKPAGSPTRYDSPYNIHGASPPSPPPRALELVKEEVHRALQAFSTRPLKGETHPPAPRDLLRPYDTTRDGRITYLEFEAGLRGLGVGLTGGEAKELARDVDGGDTGLVERERFEAAAVSSWGRGAATVATPSSAASAAASAAAPPPTGSFSATEYRDGSNNIVYDRGAPSGGPPPRDGKRVSWREGEQQQVEPRCTDDFDVEPRVDGRRGHSCKFGDGGGTAWKAVLPSGSAYADRDQGSRVTIVSGRESGMGENPYAGARGLPPPPSMTQNMKGASNSYAAGKSRGSSVSFEQWHRRMTAGGDGKHAAKVSADSVSASGRGKARGRARSVRERADSLNTLRFLLRGEVPDSGSTMEGDAGNHGQWFENRDREDRNKPHRHQHQQSSSRREERALPGAADDGTGGCGGTNGGERRGRVGVRKSLAPSERHAVGLEVYSATDSVSSGGGRRTGAASHRADGDASASLQEQERAHKHAGRAESILRVRSRGDWVGLRRALSRADPSGSGVISQREMERVFLRRFGSGFSDDEARGLAARYGKKISGRAMVDYGRLFDSLEAKEAGLCGEAALQREQPSNEKREKHAGSATPRAILPAPAGSRSSNRQTGCARTMKKGDGDGSVREAPPEESQLARRARAKTLALLDLHGTRSVDKVFGLIDPGERFG